MQSYSIRFTLGKASSVHGGNIKHNNRDFIANNILIENTDKNITYKEQDIEKAYHDLFDDAPCESERGELAKQMLDEYMKDFERRNPNLHVFNSVLHLDEASPHLHIDFIPFYKNDRERF